MADKPLPQRRTVARRAIIDVRLDGVTTAPVLHATMVALASDGQQIGERQLVVPVASLPPGVVKHAEALLAYLREWAEGA